MHRGRTELFVVFCATILVASCDKEPPLGLDDPAALAAIGEPLNLTATAASHTRIDLAWTDVSVREGGFELQRAAGSGGAFFEVTTTGPDVTSFSDAGLSPTTHYCYRARTFRTTGKKTSYSAFSNTACATTQDPPPPPPGPAAPTETNARPASNLNQTAHVTWKDNSSDESGFRVQRSSSADGPWEIAAQLGANATSHFDYGRALEQQWCYRVVSFYSGQGESVSNVDCTYLPAAASGLTAVADGGSAVNLSWTDNSGYEEGYEIERSETGGWPFTTVGSVGGNTTTFRDASVIADRTYTYRVWVTREGARAGVSNEARAITASAAPAAPSDVNAIPAGSTVVQVGWIDNSTNETAFRLERSENGGATWSTLGSTPYAGFWDYNLTSDRQVCYRAIAVNALGESPASAMDCTAPPAAPTALEASTAPGLAIQLTWTDNSTVEDGYEVRRHYQYCYYGCYEYYLSVGTVDPNVTSFRDEIQIPGFFTYVVVALKDGGQSDQSNAATASSEFPPAAPSNLTATAVSRAQIDLAWADNSDNEVNFHIYRCTGTEASCTDASFVPIIWWIAPDATTFSDTSVQPNTTYTYRVYGCNSLCSTPTNKATATTPP